MALFKSGNPALTEKIFDKSLQVEGEGVMTERGTLNKFGFLAILLMAGAFFTWNSFYQGKNVFPWMIGSIIIALIIALVLAFKPRLAPYLAPAYALIKGVVVGGISAVYNYAFAETAPGIVMQAVGLTFGVVIAMYLLYHFRIIKATKRFKSIVITATVGIAIFYLLSFILSFVGIQIPLIHSSSMWGIGFSLLVVGLAALNLILDFDMIEQGVTRGAPKYMEWYGAFGLIVTIVWLYIELLRLLSKLSSRN